MKKTTEIQLFHKMNPNIGLYGDEFEQEYPWLEQLASESGLLLDHLSDLFDYPITTDPGARFLNQKDYTLNSPLIEDEIREFSLYILKRPYSDFFRNDKLWKRREFMYRNYTKDPGGLHLPNTFHSWVAKLFQSTSINTDEFATFIRQVDLESEKTFIVPQTFLKGWANLSLHYQRITPMDYELRKYGQIFWDLYWITMVINCSTPTERDSLNKLKKLNYKDEEDIWEVDTQLFGSVIVGAGVVFLVSENRFLDRNMLLMVKDVALARFQTLANIKTRSFPPYEPEHYQTILNLYRSGDSLLQRHGNMAYECIKTLESYAVNELDKLASHLTPLIPRFESYQYYLDLKEEELGQKYVEFHNFVKIIKSSQDVQSLLTAYGSFRHWGHPFIDYIEGLKALHENVTLPKEIDVEYAEALASDLARKILSQKFLTESKWYVDLAELPVDHTFYKIIKANTWPSLDHIRAFGDQWHKLPLVKCFEIPDVIDPSNIYSDKSHSPQLSEVIQHVLSKSKEPIRSKKVLETFLKRDSTDWTKLLMKINDEGLSIEDLIIGLTGKEREIKWKGRFFSLMSWNLREYFVVTEYLIKEFILPYFKDITMADDQTTVTRKMLERTKGQGDATYEQITIANHLDYEKWNNHQRAEANNPVFRVMGQFLGYPKLIERTHEFFQKSQVYYKDRPDLMTVENGRLVNAGEAMVCWSGQLGGFEGLRQKGWSVVNLLAVERSGAVRNTNVSALAQGDNQVIITKFKTSDWRDDSELQDCLKRIVINNGHIMSSIREGTEKLGLIINQEETIQSANLLVYGKNILYRGCLLGLEEKRLSRVTCMTNDQMPTMGNMLSTVTTNCLTVAHYSKDPVNAIYAFNWLANFSRKLMEIHNPALRKSIRDAIPEDPMLDTREFHIVFMYLDPSLGGVGGMSLTRFLIRQFPDPVTETLSFWKVIHDNTQDVKLRSLAKAIGNPRIGRDNLKSFERLIEDPVSLNIPSSISAKTLIQEEIRKNLVREGPNIKNHIVRNAICHQVAEGDQFITYLRGITPCFPRFLSEFKEATYDGLASKVIGLFENSRTIRRIFQKRMGERVDQVIQASEICSIVNLLKITKQYQSHIWNCSSIHADQLREKSWRRKIVGATVPHPIELVGSYGSGSLYCDPCREGGDRKGYVAAVIPLSFDPKGFDRGNHEPYLGSYTSESTGLVQAWEKTTTIPFIKRAMDLRKSIGWCVDPADPLAFSILDNIRATTGEEPGTVMSEYYRTGCPVHRFSCSRVSSGGFIAHSPIYATWMSISTDPLNYSLDGNKNYTFMFQPCLLYAQGVAGVRHSRDPRPHTVHCHLKCLDCLQEAEDVSLSSDSVYKFMDVSEELESWKPTGTDWIRSIPILTVKKGDWDSLEPASQSFFIGSIQGFMFGELYSRSDTDRQKDTLFPYTLHNQLLPGPFLSGVASGLVRASCLALLHRKSLTQRGLHWEIIECNLIVRINSLVSNPKFLKIMEDPEMITELMTVSHRMSPGFPTLNIDAGNSIKAYLRMLWEKYFKKMKAYNPQYSGSWIFSEFASAGSGGVYILSSYVSSLMLSKVYSKETRERIRELASIVQKVRSRTEFDMRYILGHGPIFGCDRETRHCSKEIKKKMNLRYPNIILEFGTECVGTVTSSIVRFDHQVKSRRIIRVPRIQCPLISGLRIARLATGSHYKLRCLLNHLDLNVQDALCAGDGSGGWGSCVLRRYPLARLIFNSLMDFKNYRVNGVTPNPPSAIYHLGGTYASRCINLENAWENPSDLSDSNTWRYFVDLRNHHGLRINLITIDMESIDELISRRVERNLQIYASQLLDVGGVLIYKTYVHRIWNNKDDVLSLLGPYFHKTTLCQTEFSSSFTSEIYILFEEPHRTTLGPSYPDWKHMKGFIMNTYCFRTIEEEFQRAKDLTSKYERDITQGVDISLLPNSKNELIDILLGIGITNQHVVLVGELMKTLLPDQGGEFGLYLLLVISVLSFPVSGPKEYVLSPPSDQKCIGALAALVGVGYWVALVWNDVNIFKTVQTALEKGIVVYYQVLHAKGGDKKTVYRFDWSLVHKYRDHKFIRLDSKLSLIGSMIRLLKHNFLGRSGTGRPEKVRDLYSKHKFSIDVREALERTGAWDLLGFTQRDQ